LPSVGIARRNTTALGAALQMCRLWLFWRSHHDLGGNWSPSLEIAEQQTLVTRGVYARVRHPMYAAQALLALAQDALAAELAGRHGWSAHVSGVFISSACQARSN
jgi:protein-S-isoprenylcysteine O-methyltransferase Ste14